MSDREALPIYELDEREPVAWLNWEGKLVGADPEHLPRILFADVPVMMHLTCGVSLAPLESRSDLPIGTVGTLTPPERREK